MRKSSQPGTAQLYECGSPEDRECRDCAIASFLHPGGGGRGKKLDRRLSELRRSDPAKAYRERLELELNRVSSAASRLVGAYQEDLLSLDELRARMPELRKRQSTLQAQLDALATQQVDRESYLALAENLESLLARLSDSAENAPIEDRQRILRLIVRDDASRPRPSGDPTLDPDLEAA